MPNPINVRAMSTNASASGRGLMFSSCNCSAQDGEAVSCVPDPLLPASC